MNEKTTPTPSLTIIGSGTCMPLPHRKAPCNLVSTGKAHFLVDSGPGSLQALAAQKIDPTTLSGVFYTHFHGDHIGDLNNIITWLWVRTWANNYAGDTTLLPVFTIYGPAGLVTYVQNLYKYASLASMPPCVQFVEVAPNETITLDNCSVTAFKVPHTAESVGYRFTFANGKTLAISGDTAHNNSVINLIKNVDVAVLECSYDDDFHEKTKHEVHHLSPTTAAQLAQQAGAKTLILTHIYPCADIVDIAGIAQKVFNGKIIVASDGMYATIE